MPQSIEVRMVDASTLSDYEVWFFLASLAGSGVTGFFVAYMQAANAGVQDSSAWGWMTLILVTMFVVFVAMAFTKRAALRRKGRTINLKTASASSVERQDG